MALKDAGFRVAMEGPLVRSWCCLIGLMACGGSEGGPDGSLSSDENAVVTLPLDELAAEAPVNKLTPDTRRATDRVRRRSKRAPRPIGPWGLPNVWRWEGCAVGTSGRMVLPGETGRAAELTLEEMLKLPQAKKVPSGRHKGEPGLRMSDLLGRKGPVKVIGCDGEEEVIDTKNDWWIVTSTSDFIKLIRTDVRSDKFRDVTEVEFIPEPPPGMKPRGQ